MTNGSKRFPSKSASIVAMKDAGINFKTVLDVGVQAATQELIETCGDAMHYLFEPVTDYNAVIKKNYANVKHELINVAVSNVVGFRVLELKSIGGASSVTHSNVGDQIDPESQVKNKIKTITIDDFCNRRTPVGPELLKIDVDGHEFEILEGVTSSTSVVDAIIIESSPRNIERFISIISPKGYFLWDICDFCYYRNVLAQIDLVFVHERWAKNPGLRPLHLGGPFVWGDWAPFKERLKERPAG